MKKKYCEYCGEKKDSCKCKNQTDRPDGGPRGESQQEYFGNKT